MADPQNGGGRQPFVPTITAGADIEGYGAGTQLNDFGQLVDAFTKRFGRLRHSGGGPGREEVIVASIHADYPDERTLVKGDPDTNMAKIRETLSPEAILASGGLCAPVAPYYELMVIAEDLRPVAASLATFAATRGGHQAPAASALERPRRRVARPEPEQPRERDRRRDGRRGRRWRAQALLRRRLRRPRRVRRRHHLALLAVLEPHGSDVPRAGRSVRSSDHGSLGAGSRGTSSHEHGRGLQADDVPQDVRHRSPASRPDRARMLVSPQREPNRPVSRHPRLAARLVPRRDASRPHEHARRRSAR